MAKPPGSAPSYIFPYDLPIYEMLSETQVQMQEQQQHTRVTQIRETLEVVDELYNQFETIRAASLKNREWNRHLKCDGLPKPYLANDIREFLYQIELLSQKLFKEPSWMLEINERSILTQDTTVPNKTKRLLKSRRRNYGTKFYEYTEKLFTLLSKVEEAFQSLRESNQIISPDLNKAKIEIHNKIQSVIDFLTLKVISSEEAEMETLDVSKCQFRFSSNEYSVHVWAYKDLPIHFDKDLKPSEIVNFDLLNLILNLPYPTLRNNLTVRGIHSNYDHFTELTRIESIKHIPKHVGFKQALNSDWNKYKEIQTNVKERLTAENKMYRRYLVSKEEYDKRETKKKDKKSGKSETGKGKTSKGPQEIREDDYPEVIKDFLKFDELNFLSEKNQFNPMELNLEDHEINLRQYIPCGGVYQFHFLVKPKQMYYSQKLMRWFENPIEVLDYEKDWIENVKFDQIHDKNSDQQFFILKFKIPLSFCKWSVPIPVQFIPGLDLIEEDLLQLEKNNLDVEVPLIINDFNLTDLLTTEQVYTIAKYSLSRVLSTHELSDETVKSTSKFSKLHTQPDSTQAQQKDDEPISAEKPERLFPIFPKLQPIFIIQNSNEFNDKLFSDLLRDFDVVKDEKQPFFKTSKKDLKKEFRKSRVFQLKRKPSRKFSTASSYRGSQKIRDSSFLKKNSTRISSERITISSRESRDSKTLKNKFKIMDTDDELVTPHNDVSSVRDSEKFEINIVDGTVKEFYQKDTDKHTKWSTKNIYKSEFDQSIGEMKIWTDRLGVFGFMYPRYLHFPYKIWTLEPNPDDPKNKFTFKIETDNVKFLIDITEKGYTCNVANFGIFKSREEYLNIPDPVDDLRIIRERLQVLNLNIFPQPDAAFYINSLVSEKYKPLENHTYNCMAILCPYLKYAKSEWNRLSSRRAIIFKCSELKGDSFEVKCTTEETKFVEIEELCNLDLDVIELDYKYTWRNVEFCADFFHLIDSSYPQAASNRVEDPKLFNNITNFLQTIRPFSFS